MQTEELKDGPVTYQQSPVMVTFAEKCLLEYFAQFGPKRPGDLEDDFCGEPGMFEMMSNFQGRWRSSPFYPALGRLVDKQQVQYRQDETGGIWYSLKA
jgi:hypothetical protein